MRLSEIVRMLFNLYYLTLIARIVVSWLRIHPSNGIVRFIYDMTEPVMAPFRRLLPAVGGLDLSPILVFMLLNWLGNQVTIFLMRMGL